MKYNKLVRDKIPEYVKSKNGTPITYMADEKEYWQKLKEKLKEETEEFNEAENEEELADILEVIDAICVFKNFKAKKILQIKKSKAKEKGAFKKRIILKES